MKQNLELSNEKLQSEVISFLRFPLIVGVVMIHVGVGTSLCESAPLYHAIHYLFAQILARIAVPLFFMFSGYLLFNRCTEYPLHLYKTKLKSRFITLFVPYLIWNLLAVIFYSLLNRGMISCIEDLFKAFWNLRIEPAPGATTPAYPINIQFWYIRDLIVLVVLSPITYWLIKILKYWWVILLCILWVGNWWYHISGLSITGVFFFSLGAYYSIHRKNFVNMFKKHVFYWGILYAALIFPVLLIHAGYWTPLRRVTILVGVVFTLALTAKMIGEGKWKVNKFLSESSFFIFACHMFVLSPIGLILEKIIPLNSDINLVACYFLKIMIVTILGLIAYYTMKIYVPKTTTFITGGR